MNNLKGKKKKMEGWASIKHIESGKCKLEMCNTLNDIKILLTTYHQWFHEVLAISLFASQKL